MTFCTKLIAKDRIVVVSLSSGISKFFEKILDCEFMSIVTEIKRS
jgi:hypothetical protein